MVRRVAGALVTLLAPFPYLIVQTNFELVPIRFVQQVNQSIVKSCGGRPVAGVRHVDDDASDLFPGLRQVRFSILPVAAPVPPDHFPDGWNNQRRDTSDRQGHVRVLACQLLNDIIEYSVVEAKL